MNKKSLKIIVILIGLISIAFVLVNFFTLIGYKCPWRLYFNIICAGCGVTRMIKSIFRLEIYNAFLYNPLFFILFSIIILYLLYVLICTILRKKYYVPSIKLLYPLAAIIVIFMILRNIPSSPLYDIWPK